MKKIISFMLAVVLLVSAVPMVYAAETQDYSLGTSVVYTADDEANENWTVTVPALLAPGTSGTVTLDGYWPSTKTITVTADTSVTLTNNIKTDDQKVLDVTFYGIEAAGSNTESQTFTQQVSVSGIENALFGTWSGHFYYTVGTVEDAVETAGLYGTDGSFIPWATLVADGTVTVTDGVVTTGFWYYEEEGNPYFGNTSAEALDGRLVIDSSVTSLGNYAFSNCTSLTSVNIPDSVTSIGEGALGYCPLTSIDIPDSVTSIGKSAFVYCTSLTSVNIPNSVTSIGNYAFSNCTSLTSIDIPNNITSISDYAFLYCTSLTSIDIPNSVTSIGRAAFYACPLTSIDIPYEVTSIGEEAFGECRNLTSIDIPYGVTSLGKHTFLYCTSLTSVNIPNSVTSIGEEAFVCCTSLTSVNIPNSVTSIGKGAFGYCTNLTSVNIPDSVTSIGSSAFAQCTSLTSVNIPDSVTSIGSSAFRECLNLAKINYSGTTEQWGVITLGGSGSTAWNYNAPATEVICSDGTVALS